MIADVRVKGVLLGIVGVAAAVVVAGAPAGCGGSLGGKTGTGGTTGAGGTPGWAEPTCPSTVTKGSACGPSDIQFCYNPCGPHDAGAKTETCTTAGTYAEMAGCTFDPSRDFSCYKLPSAANATCPPAVTPQAGAACVTPACVVCNSLAGMPEGQYLDSTGALQIGFCVCGAAGGGGARTWSCAPDIAWPCPLGSGC